MSVTEKRKGEGKRYWEHGIEKVGWSTCGQNGPHGGGDTCVETKEVRGRGNLRYLGWSNPGRGDSQSKTPGQ